jgi:hypothetical protein
MKRSAVFRVLLYVTAFGATQPALAIGDGARAYQLLPAGTQVLSAYGIFLDGNSSLDPSTAAQDARISVDVLAVQYTRSITLGGQLTGLFAVLPVGQVDGSVTIDRPLRPPVDLAGRSSGLADIQFGAVFGLVGSPALDRRDYASFKPGFAMGVLTRVTAPTGAYSSDRAINLGANRWAFQLGAPLGFTVGQSMLDPSLTTFELIPSVTFFTANDDPYGANSVTQRPIYRIEAHATRNVNQALWFGVDALATFGGETKTDGRYDDNAKYSLELGATVGFYLSQRFLLKATYGGVVARNDNGLDGRGFRLVGTLLF